MKNVIVTGANGFIGLNLVNELLKRNYHVVAIDKSFKKEFINNRNVTCVKVPDKSVFNLINEIPDDKYECFFHFAWAATSGLGRSDYNIQLDNVRMSCDYVKLCSSIKCKRFVYASSINEMETYEYLQSDDVEPSGGYIYGTGKLAGHLFGETVAKLNCVDFIPIIITNIYGIGERSARLIYTSLVKLLKGEHVSFTSGFQTYDFIYISDAINSIIEVAEKGKPFNRYYIGSGSPKPLRYFLIKMKDVIDPKIRLGLGDLPFKGVDISYSQFDLKKVEKDTGYKNLVTFEQGIKMTVDWIKSENK